MLRTPAIALLFCARAFGAGFAVPEQSARAVGSGGTGTASVQGASAIYYNPGLLAFEDGISAELSATLILLRFRYQPLEGGGPPSEVEPSAFVLPSVFAAAPVIEDLFVGLGGFSNFGLGLRWPADFAGRFEASTSNITTFTVNPAAAYRVDDHVGVGAGVGLVRATVELGRQLDFIDAEGSLRLGGGAWGFGFNLGAAGRWLNERLAAGINYRSATSLSFHGRADFTVPREFEAQLQDQDVATHLTLPHLLSLGASYRPTPTLRLSADATWATWSALDALQIDFEESETLDQNLRRDWRNTLTARAGGELSVTETLTLRAGMAYDPSPSPADTVSPSLPDGDRIVLSAGVGYRLGSLSADLGYLLALITPRETSGEAFPARYQGTAHLVSLTLAARQ